MARLQLAEKATQLDGSEGILKRGRPDVVEPGDAFVGRVTGAARAFGAAELFQNPGGSQSVLVGRAHVVPGVAHGAPIGYPLGRVPLAGGRTAWLVSDRFASIPSCEPDEG
jgi:hypothetical protein